MERGQSIDKKSVISRVEKGLMILLALIGLSFVALQGMGFLPHLDKKILLAVFLACMVPLTKYLKIIIKMVDYKRVQKGKPSYDRRNH